MSPADTAGPEPTPATEAGVAARLARMLAIADDPHGQPTGPPPVGAEPVPPEAPYRPTVGDLVDMALGGPAVVVCANCTAGHHRVCLGSNGGRTCQCGAGPHPLRRPR